MSPYAKILAVGGENLWEKLVHWYQNSVFAALLRYLSDDVFGMEFGVYENFTLGSGTAQNVRRVIIGFMFGAIIAAAYMSYTKLVQGRFIRTLLRRGCLSPETAITLHEAGVFTNLDVRRDLLRGGPISKLTARVDALATDASAVDRNENTDATDGDRTPENSSCTSKNATRVAKNGSAPDFLTARFYIPEDLKYTAEFKFEKKGTDFRALLFAVAVFLVCAAFIAFFLPDLLQFIDNIIGMFDDKKNIIN